MEPQEPVSYRVGVVLHILEDQPWGAAVLRELSNELATRPGFELEVEDPHGRSANQLRQVEAMLDARVDALIVAPLDPVAIRPLLARFRKEAIPVIVVDNDLEDPSLYDALILADNRQFGQSTGALLAEVTGGAADVVQIRGIESTTAARDRDLGFREVLARHPRMRIVDTCTGDWFYEKARAEFARVLQRQRRIDAVFAQNDEMARAALDVAAEAGREEEMLVTGIDALPGENGIRLVSQGRLAATFLNPSPAREAAHTLFAILDGEPYPKRTLLKTSPLKSNARIRAWQAARRGRGA